MLKALKYIYLVNIYSKSKKSLLMLLIYSVLLIFLSLMLNDIIAVSTGLNAYFFIFIKWFGVLVLLVLMLLSLMKVINVASNPLASNSKSIDEKKEKLLSKEKLRTKSDQIIEKYMEMK